MNYVMYDRGDEKSKCEFCYNKSTDCYFLYIKTAGPIDHDWYWICEKCVDDRNNSYRYDR